MAPDELGELMDHRDFYIDGVWVKPAVPRDLPVLNPATEETVAVISLGGQADTDAAVAAARRALDGWAATPVAERIAALERLLALYRESAADIARAMQLEMGAPQDLAMGAQVESGAGHLEETIRVARGFAFEVARGDDLIAHDPIGVCALITPWNWPMNQVMLKLAPALAAGCTVVLKPSEIAPLSSMVLAGLIDRIGLPRGVFNLVNGDGPGVGSQLSAHPGVDMVSFTGSTRAGALISKAAADTVKRVTLELGGKGANIIFADADEEAVERGVLHCMENTGQSCDAPTRMLVERSVYDRVVQQAAQAARAVAVGDPAQPGAHIGPLVSKTHWDKVQGLIRQGMAEGARLVAGGPGLPDGMTRGYFARPTVFADVTNTMTIAREEVFGPVLVLIPFDTEEDAIAIANDTPYGLGNYVQTADKARAARVARRLRSGMVKINGAFAGYDTPFGGVKMSGNGREGSDWGLHDYLEVKVLSGLAG